MTKQKVLSSNMAASPLSFGSLGIGHKPPIFFKELYSNIKLLLEQQEKNIEELPRREEQTIVGCSDFFKMRRKNF